MESAGFKQKQREIEGLKYSGSQEFNKEKEYTSLEKSKEIRMYLKTRDGSELKKFREMDGSKKIQEYEELEKFHWFWCLQRKTKDEADNIQGFARV
ncbi:MAG: hypothetical protein MZV63_59940 [Marinilabiliales bacterium]|nr:hypothetical protein [Marinilabiliales bacterium]